jgi:signal transduction histidine kinase
VRARLNQAHPVRPDAIPLHPVAERATGDAVESALALLHAGMEVVRASCEAEGGEAVDRGDALRQLDWLATAVTDGLHGQTPARSRPAATALGRHLLRQLRAEVLRAWRSGLTPADPTAVLTLLEAIEGTRTVIEPEPSDDFRARLVGPDGLELVVGVAHDLRSPLTSILFLAETLGRGRSGPVNELQHRQLRLIYSAALGLNSLASDVIELARGGDRLIETDPEPFSLAEVFESLHDMVRPIAEEKELTFRYTVPASYRRIGKPLALSRVLLNLTTNAFKFTDKGFVEITTKPKGLSGLEFSVRDTGHGINKESLANLFQPFQRSRSRRGRGYYFSGTGLGLAMCRKLVEAMGSELKCESRPDWGTRFHFEIDLPIVTRP